jgi:hypothetical protein
VQGAGGGIFPLAFGIIRDEFPRDRVSHGIGLMSSLLGVGGGLAIVACCDLVYATPDARFGAPVARTLGNCVSPATTARLRAGLGRALTTELLLTGRLATAKEALAAGLVRAIVEPADLDGVFGRADVVSCHLPWSAETFHLIGERQFGQMRPSAIFVNTGRGKVVDEAALIRALESGRLGGAGLDVLEQEPPDPANPLLRMPNVILSPHMASVSDVSAVARRRLLGRQIAATLRGEVPTGVVNPAVLPRWRGQAGAASA